MKKPEAVDYPEIRLLIDGKWRGSGNARTLPVLNPATEDVIGHCPVASEKDLSAAAEAADRGFHAWRKKSAHERYVILARAADLLIERADHISRLLTLEIGRPLAQSRSEVLNGADMLRWLAEEARRITSTLIPARVPGVEQRVERLPIGPVAAFTPWNFPINQSVRKIGAALAAGCSVILKGPEEAPASSAALVAAFDDAGVPAGAIGLVFGLPAMISEYLIAHPLIRKISFTGSTSVGKQLAALAGTHMKPATMELGGHGPALICEDADVPRAVSILSSVKYRNAGQVCTSPTRFLVHRSVFDCFVETFVEAVRKLQVGDGFDEGVHMGPLAHSRRVEAVEALVGDAIEKGAVLRTGGQRLGNRGYFYAPTVFTDVPVVCRIMNEEPFGPIAIINRYPDDEAMIAEANRLRYGLGAYVYSGSPSRGASVAARIEAGMVTVNHQGFGLPEAPFGGVRDSGYGNEGGTEAVNAYLVSKYVTRFDAEMVQYG